MKKSILLFILFLWFMGKNNAQNWVTIGNTPSSTPILGTTNNFDVWFYANGYQYMDLQWNTGALGIGLNHTPSYQLDVQCNPSLPSLKDINVSTTNSTQNVGYRIGGQYVLWHNGITSNIFVGVNAGNATGTGQANTFVGYNAGNSFVNAGNNTAVGEDALLLNQTGGGNTAIGSGSLQNNLESYNTAVGAGALYANNILAGNTAVGDSALFNLTGITPFNSGNVAIGNSTLYADGASFNTAVGEWAMRHNTHAAFTVAVGFGALYSNTIGGGNEASGYEAMFSNTTGGENTADGWEALYTNTVGNDNTAVGNAAGQDNQSSYNTFLGENSGAYNTTTGYNTFVGCFAGGAAGFGSVTNTTCLGYSSGVLASTIGSNSVYLGNSSTTSIYGATGTLTTYSDRRIKDNIQENVPGLAFIEKLHPVTYNLDIHKEAALLNTQDTANWPGKYDIEKITQSGFIAQQVDSAAQACGYDFNGVVKPKTPNGLYGLGYTDFVVPLVKAVQELNAKNDTLHASNDSLHTTVNNLQSKVDSLRSAMQNIQTCVNQLCGATGGNFPANTSPAGEQNVSLSSANAPLLYQNTPNPFNTGTKINYYLPEGTMGATVVFYDNYGNQIKTIQLSQTGNGTLNVTPDNLSNGIYSYSLIVNGAVVDTKKMVLQK